MKVIKKEIELPSRPKEQAGIQRKWKRKALSEEPSRTGPKKRITKVVFFLIVNKHIQQFFLFQKFNF